MVLVEVNMRLRLRARMRVRVKVREGDVSGVKVNGSYNALPVIFNITCNLFRIFFQSWFRQCILKKMKTISWHYFQVEIAHERIHTLNYPEFPREGKLCFKFFFKQRGHEFSLLFLNWVPDKSPHYEVRIPKPILLLAKDARVGLKLPSRLLNIGCHCLAPKNVRKRDKSMPT